MKKVHFALALLVVVFTWPALAAAQNNLDQRLFEAARDGNLSAISQLINQGANVNAKISYSEVFDTWSRRFYDYTPLSVAAEKGRLEAILLLLKRGADIEGTDGQGNTALVVAAGAGQLESVKLLLKKGAKIDNPGRFNTTALLEAADEGKTEMVRLLLEKGADIEFQGSPRGYRPLHAAASEGHLATIDLLLQKGAKRDVENRAGESAIMVAAESGKIEALQLLKEKGADPTARGRNGVTALILASAAGRADVVRLLLQLGASANDTLDNGKTALISAADGGHTEAARALIEHGAQIETPTRDGSAPLLWAAYLVRAGVVQLLLEKGANVDTRKKEGVTPLIAAACSNPWSSEAEKDKVTTVKALLEHGANVMAKASDGETPTTCPNRTKPAAVAALLDSAIQRNKDLEQADLKPPAERLAFYKSAFDKNPRNDFLRSKVIAAAVALPQPPAVPEASRQLFALATDQIKQATTPSALDSPIALLDKALTLAPWWGNAYYNLSRALEMQGRYSEAIQQMRLYLETKPSETDAEEAKGRIVVLETQKEIAEKSKK